MNKIIQYKIIQYNINQLPGHEGTKTLTRALSKMMINQVYTDLF